MQSDSYPASRDLVLIGGGHAHALVLRRWGMNPLAGVRLTLISPDPTAPYTGMLPGLVAGHYGADDLQIDLVRLARFAGARLVPGRVTGIDRQRQRIAVTGRGEVAYDLTSIDVGIGSDLPLLPGFAHHGQPAKPLGGFVAGWDAALARFAAGQRPAVVVLGGGVAGVELALAMAHRMRSAGLVPEVVVVERGTLLAGIGARARAVLERHLMAAGIVVRLGVEATRVEAGQVVLAGGQVLVSHFTVGSAGAVPQGWLPGTELTLERGFVSVSPTLQSLSDPMIFAAGDCAHMAESPRPKAGVYAVRQAPVLHHNLRAVLTGEALQRYTPQRDYLKLISTGGKGAVADRAGLQAGGAWLWRLKDGIDRRFMARFQDLPVAAGITPLPQLRAAGLAELAAEQPLCGGCGAKLGRQDLDAALAVLAAPTRADVLSGRGDDAAVLVHGDGRQVLTTDHLRSVTADPWLMAQIAATHALGDIWAMGASPQAALSQIILPRMAAALQARTLAEITEAAAAVFAGAGADLVGGHTSIGAELTIGFTVTGLASGPVVAKGGAQAGDALILTKALGVGIILAADMAGRAPGPVVAAAYGAMVAGQGEAAALLAGAAHAMTDVTGFGLAGHLAEMLAGSGLGAAIGLDALPVLTGALALAADGVRSSLHPQNRTATVVVGIDDAEARFPAKAALLFDPQTCGGLLAAVPWDQATGLVVALQAMALPAAVIGRVVADRPGITLVPGGGGQFTNR